MTEKEEKIIAPDSLSLGKYIYKYGKEGPKEYVNRYADIDNTDDLLRSWTSLSIQRRDGMEMHRDEIKKIREDFFNDVSEWLPYLLMDDSVVSIYKNKKLYFWIAEERMSYPTSDDEFLIFIQDIFEYLGYEGGKLMKRNIGFDLIYPAYELALICIDDNNYWEKHEKERVIKKEELTDISKNTSKYKNRRIILGCAELSGELVEYAKSQNIEIQTIKDVIKEKNMLESEVNDEYADTLEIPRSIK